MESIDPRRLLAGIAKILNRLKIPYFVTGGMAVLIWGKPRFTADIDIVIQLKYENAVELKNALLNFRKRGYIDDEAIKEAIRNKGEFNFIDVESGVKIDFWILKELDQFVLEQLKRKVAKKVFNEKVFFISPEDLILNKLTWFEKSQSSRHLEDIESVFKISGKKLDKNYLKKQAAKRGVAYLLKNFINQYKDRLKNR